MISKEVFDQIEATYKDFCGINVVDKFYNLKCDKDFRPDYTLVF